MIHMNAFTMLPYALPFIALGTYAMLRFARWLDTPHRAARMRRQAILWHNAVTDHEIAQGTYSTEWEELTDIDVNHGYVI
jgi:hypothetical protein